MTVIIVRPHFFSPLNVLKDGFLGFHGQAIDSHSACVGWEKSPEAPPEEVPVCVEGGSVS